VNARMREHGDPGISLKPRPLSTAASANLDLIRATAAWAVMWGHVRALFFVRYSELEHPHAWVKFFYFVTGFGHPAVIIFFVLSGFLISSSVFKSYGAGSWRWRDYAINRSVRLYIVLIPGLLFGLAWDLAGSVLFRSSGLYSHPFHELILTSVQDNLTFRTFSGNLLFLQTIVCPTFGSNGPLWSLANEFWYYVLFPCLFFAVIFFKQASRRGIFFILVALFVAAFLGPEKLAGFLVWLAGCAVVIISTRSPTVPLLRLIPYASFAFILFSVCMFAARTGSLGVLGNDVAIGISFSFFLFLILQIDVGRRHAAVSHSFADFSYSLYVLHFPFLLFLRAWIPPSEGWQPNPLNIVLAVMVGSAVLCFAWMVSLFTEKKTRFVQEWFRNRVRERKEQIKS
jgi:peptidoglycan/LPS O-acetylase OafA/YrhL